MIESYESETDHQKRIKILQKLDNVIFKQHPYVLDWYRATDWIAWWDKFGMPAGISHSMIDPRHSIWSTWWYQPERVERLNKARAAGTSIPLAPVENTTYKD